MKYTLSHVKQWRKHCAFAKEHNSKPLSFAYYMATFHKICV